jgi:hypothetical protein
VGGVLQATDAEPVIVVADPADEERQAPGRVVVQGGQHLGDVERGLAEVDEPYGGVRGACGHGPTLARPGAGRTAVRAQRTPGIGAQRRRTVVT